MDQGTELENNGNEKAKNMRGPRHSESKKWTKAKKCKEGKELMMEMRGIKKQESTWRWKPGIDHANMH
jgi:hypothetical protein